MLSPESELPEYARPPVVETVFGVQFDPLPDLTNAHLGAFWTELGIDDWPQTTDAPPLPSQFERFTKSAQWAAGFRIHLSQNAASRLQIKNRTGERMVQVQNERLHFNWLGDSGGSYPRYAVMRNELSPLIARFTSFVSQTKVGEFRPNQWEVTYINIIPKGTVWDSPDDWGFFQLLRNVPSINGISQAESFKGEWHFVIPPELGRLHIEWQHGISSAEQNGQESIRLTLTARGPITPKGEVVKEILAGLDLGHETIVRAFASLMNNNANSYWGLKNVNANG